MAYSQGQSPPIFLARVIEAALHALYSQDMPNIHWKYRSLFFISNTQYDLSDPHAGVLWAGLFYNRERDNVCYNWFLNKFWFWNTLRRLA